MITRYILFAIFLLTFLCASGCVETVGGKGQKELPLPEIKKDCTTCHTSHDVKKGTTLLKQPVSELCIGCHPDRKAPSEHKVDIVPSMKVVKLPLKEGKITCITCHDPHKNAFGRMLRMPQNNLCLTCHNY